MRHRHGRVKRLLLCRRWTRTELEIRGVGESAIVYERNEYLHLAPEVVRNRYVRCRCCGDRDNDSPAAPGRNGRGDIRWQNERDERPQVLVHGFGGPCDLSA